MPVLICIVRIRSLSLFIVVQIFDAYPYVLIYFTDTSIQVTNDVAHQIYAGTPGAQVISDTLWSIPCNSTFQITLTFAGQPFTIYERDTILKGPYGICTGVITGGARGIGKVGAPFLRNVYTYVTSSLFILYRFRMGMASDTFNFFFPFQTVRSD